MREQRPFWPKQLDAWVIRRRRSEVNRKQSSAGDRSQRVTKRRRTSLRAGVAVIGGRAAGALSRRLHLGGGTSIVGIVAQRLYPGIVGHLAGQLEHGSVMVTGTNGKTTTSGFIAAILRDAGLRVWHNREGSNLMSGVASSLVIRALPNGNLRGKGRAISILEIDEAVVSQAVQTIPPRVAVFTNLFRDQLDRYGEVDTVAARWRGAVESLPASTTLVLNADDPTIAYLGELFKGQVIYFGIDDPTVDLARQGNASERHQVIDTRTCQRCGSEYTYTLRLYSHMGHYHCSNCGLVRPRPDIRAINIHPEGFDRLRVRVATATVEHDVVVPLPGLYNVYNTLAAIAVAQALQINWDPIVTGVEQFKPAFGRGERVQVEGRNVRLLLAKNPTGFNEVLRTLFSNGTPRNVLFVLNDNVADGRDVSWIWDVNFEWVVEQTTTLVVAGSRTLDLALRLKYAGVEQRDMTIVPPAPLRTLKREVENNRIKQVTKVRQPSLANGRVNTVEPKAHTEAPHLYGIAEALDAAVHQTPAGETLFIVPTYTGLLEIHQELERRGLTPHYWEG
jgi:lipid II isoglutaminyl synthase (glutamine-hydrolysing)